MKTTVNNIYTVVPVVTNYKCWRCPSRANWNIYLHGDPEPCGDYIAGSCTNHVGTFLLTVRYMTPEEILESEAS